MPLIYNITLFFSLPVIPMILIFAAVHAPLAHTYVRRENAQALCVWRDGTWQPSANPGARVSIPRARPQLLQHSWVAPPARRGARSSPSRRAHRRCILRLLLCLIAARRGARCEGANERQEGGGRGGQASLAARRRRAPPQALSRYVAHTVCVRAGSGRESGRLPPVAPL